MRIRTVAVALLSLALFTGVACAQAQVISESRVSQGDRFQHGEGVERDLQRAMAIYCQAAKEGEAQGFFEMGWMYANARGVPRDDGLARYLFERAAEYGHRHAAQLLRNLPAASPSLLPECLQPEPATQREEDAYEHPYPRGPIYELVSRLAPQYGVDSRFALAVISVESGFQPKAVSPRNAQGLMQLMPETAHRFRVRNAFDPEDNIKGGLSYLRWLLAYFQGNVTLVAAAYNAGERAVELHGGIPPYPETRDYIRKITRLYRKTRHPFQSHIVGASPLMTRSANLSK